MSSSSKLIAATVALAAVAAGGAAFAAVKLSESTGSSAGPMTAPYVHGIAGSGLGGGRLGGRGFGGGLGPGYRPDFGRPRFFGGVSAAVSGYLGLTTATVQTDLQQGQTLAQIAKAQGKTVDGLVAAMVADQKKRIVSAVSRGALTQAQARQLESNLQRHISHMVDGVHPQSGGTA